MNIRLAEEKDLEEILKIYEYAREFMAKTGNPNQWVGGHPKKSILEDDIEKKQLFVCEKDGVLKGVFAFIIGEDPTYGYVEGGKWRNSEAYGTIHRIARGPYPESIAKESMDFCKSKIKNVRIDTHFDNKVMQKVVSKNGFEKCGVIYLEDGSPRIAYHYVGE